MTGKTKRTILLIFLSILMFLSGFTLFNSYTGFQQATITLHKTKEPKSLPTNTTQIVDLISESSDKALQLTAEIIETASSLANTKPEDIDSEDLLKLHVSEDVGKVIPRLFAVGFSEKQEPVTVQIMSTQTSYSEGNIFAYLKIDVKQKGKTNSKIVVSTYDVASDQITSIRLSNVSSFGGAKDEK